MTSNQEANEANHTLISMTVSPEMGPDENGYTETPIPELPQSFPTEIADIEVTPTLAVEIQLNVPTASASDMISENQQEDFAQLYFELNATNGDCDLINRCWWGVNIGEDTTSLLLQVYENVGASQYILYEDERLSIYEMLINNPNIYGEYQISHIFGIQDGIVIEGQVEIEGSDYEISQIIQKYGVPTEVYVWANKYGNPEYGVVKFFLFYPNLGLLFSLNVPATFMDTKIISCFENDEGGAEIVIWLPSNWDPQNIKSLEDRLDNLGNGFEKPIQTVSDWDEFKLYDSLNKLSEESCWESSIEYWEDLH